MTPKFAKLLLGLLLGVLIAVIALFVLLNRYPREAITTEKTDRVVKELMRDFFAREFWAKELIEKVEAEGEDITLPGGGFKKLTVTKDPNTELYVILDHWRIQNTGEKIPTLKVRKVVREDNNTTRIELDDLEANGDCDSGLYRTYYKGAVIEEKSFVEGVEGIPPTDPENRDFFQTEYLKILKEILEK